MNEGKKTGLFWVIAIVCGAVAAFVAWPNTSTQEDVVAGRMLFETFTNPLAASSMKIVTFDETQGTLDTFEVRKDRESDLWTIPSREGYPADAIEQMRDAANSLVGVKILDIQTSNAEDHDDLGVAEPALEDLEVGDEGVGRLVTFKNKEQETLASLIIGDPVNDDPSKRYVRIPNQDPVYVVKLDESPLTTNFRDWIDTDLLQLSSIDINTMQIKDYTATLGQRGISLSRNYTADVKLDGAQWELVSLVEFDPKDPRVEPTKVDVADDQELNKTKLNELKNALDDLKIVNVYRKPEGVSTTLKASKDLLSDQDAITSLAQRGFYPIDVGPDGEAEILSANGELSVSLKDGVKYLLRFGNIAGVGGGEDSGDEEDESETASAGVNRYLFVTTMVDESRFPAPELKEIPQTLEDLDAILNPPSKEEPKETVAEEATKEATPEEDPSDPSDPSDAPDAPDAPEKKEEGAQEQPSDEAVDADGTDEEMKNQAAKEPASESDSPKTVEEKPAEEKPADDAAEAEESGETETSGEGETTGEGQAQEAEPTDAPEADDQGDSAEESEPAEEETEPATDELTEQERQERLEAEQEKITKENQRKLDARKDQLDAASRKVRELNERFADWYYVIPEDTYSKLTISRDELLQTEGADAAATPSPPTGGPGFNFDSIPGLQGN